MLRTEMENRIHVIRKRFVYRFRLLSPLFVIFGFTASNLLSQEVDRLLVGVNGSVITEGDLYIERRLNALVFPDQTIESTSREDEIDRLINLELIRQEMGNLRVELEDEGSIDDRIEALEKEYASSGGIEAYLDRYGISKEDLISFLRQRKLTSKFLEFRFQPFVRVSESEIASYYTEILLPQLRKSEIEIPPLNEVSENIETILKEKQVNAELEEWIENARSHSEIEYFRDNDPVVFDETGAARNAAATDETE